MPGRLPWGHRALSRNPLTLVSHRHASTARPSPRVRRAQQPRAQPAVPASHAPNWPMSSLNDAYKTGLIPVEPSVAAGFLSKFFASNDGRPTLSSAQALLKEFELKPRTLFWLGWILYNRISVDPSMKNVAKTLQDTAASLEDENAALVLVESALRAGRVHHPDIQAAERTLVQMSGTGHAYALERLAALHYERGDRATALDLAEQAMKAQHSQDSQQAHILSPQFSCWRTVSKIKSEQGNPAGELEAIEFGAHVMDDPDAYCELATKKTTLGTRKHLEYLLKAAASGVGQAAYLAGEHYYAQATGKSLNPIFGTQRYALHELAGELPVLDDFQLALAGGWFQTALVAKDGPLSFDRDAAGMAAVMSLAQAGDVETARTLLDKHSGMKFTSYFR